MCRSFPLAVLVAALLLSRTDPCTAQPMPVTAGALTPASSGERGDASLTWTQAEAALLLGNPEIRVARAELDAANSAIRQADVAPNPTVFASVSNTDSGRYGARDSDRIVRIEQTFERGDKRRLRIEVATAAAEASRHALDDTIRRQRQALAGAYFGLGAARELEAITIEGAEAYRQLLGAAERRLTAGDIAPVDVVRLRVEASRAANEVHAARRDVELAQIALGALLGERAALQARALMTASAYIAATVLRQFPPTDEQIERALEFRADARSARSRLEAATRARALAASQRVRDVTLGLQTERAPAFGGNVFGVSASIPLQLNNDYRGDVARATAEQSLAEQSLFRTRASIRAEIERAAADLSAARERARSLEQQALPDARRAVEGVEFAFRKGVAGITDLFDARRQLAAIRAEAVRARTEHAVALAVYLESLVPPESK